MLLLEVQSNELITRALLSTLMLSGSDTKTSTPNLSGTSIVMLFSSFRIFDISFHIFP